MSMEDFWLLWKGFNEKLIYEQSVHRRVAYIIHCSMVKKATPIESLWPLARGKKGKGNKREEAMKTLKLFKEAEALEKFKSKNPDGIKRKDRG